ncbi:DUF2076 domain-containing protein [Gluconobacter morbifer]|uniref:Periplasmic ligand-binding sensor protein n=1 Tax=Gluconobacter morbifer G707 TaxID=1088869 RepID=G6XG29_9PROT|nr:DUF2076 domain-containing protein [Gluconobacter morbifer]EHH69137.1 hypothetical protein GMO_04440 [Gluconobacter morbifer G707]
MNNEERDLISRFIARVGGAQQGSSFGQQQTPALPPIDPEADRFIADNFQKYPEARYRITQMAVVQEAALAQAQNRIRQLEFQLQQAQQQIAQLQQQGGNKSSGGLFGGLFGGNKQANAAPPPGWGANQSAPPPNYAAGGPQNYGYPPGYQPGMFQRGGTGFLGSALTTAAGVAGGMMTANALEGLFSDHHGAAGGDAAGGFGAGGDTTVINNNYGADPFSGSGTDAGSGFSDSDFGGGGDSGGDFGGGGDGGGDGGGFDDMF